jgi:Bacterial Ig-like domain (group 3)
LKRLALLTSLAVTATLLPLTAATTAHAQSTPADAPNRSIEPVVITGAQLPAWSRLAAEGTGAPYPSGSGGEPAPVPGSDNKRDAHNGTLHVPPDARPGVDVNAIAAFKWDGAKFVEIPVQVDERFPYFLANAPSGFSAYSGTDKELTYEWDTESWAKTAGQCNTAFDPDFAADHGTHMEDPVTTFDDDDELVFMASDAGPQAPVDPTVTPTGPPMTSFERHEIKLTDPRDPATNRYVYLFLRGNGSSFTADNGYVDYQRDANADEWIDQDTFSDADPEKVGSSNTGYGPNLPGTVCTDDPDTAAVETLRNTNDRFPRDGVTVTTDSYKWRATGRWMVRDMQVRKPGSDPARGYGDDLIDRWKGRAFQQSPDSTVSLVGFEDEQVNWEGNSTLLGELEGPVRAIRETWGADSGTNVTKTETFYRDSILYRYRVRVHPIPPDGLYTSWDYNYGTASTYYNEMLVHSHLAGGNKPGLPTRTADGGVAVDGVSDEVYGNVDGVGDFPAYFDATDATFAKPVSFFNWEQVSGKEDNGSLVYMFQMNNAQSLENPLVVPYYRDDACLDDGTGDDPVRRPYPGESYEWLRDHGQGAYADEADCYKRQGAFGSHGVHYFITGDTDNATVSSAAVTEIDGQQWQWAVPTAAPQPVGDAYANTVKVPLLVSAVLQDTEPGKFVTTVEILEPHSGQTTDDVTLAARLTRNDGLAMNEEEVDMTFDGQDLGTFVTDQNGIARVPVSLEGAPRTAMVTASYAGDVNHNATVGSKPFEILKEDTVLELAQPAATQTTDGVTLSAALSHDEGVMEGRQVEFFIGQRSVGTATTNAQGIAQAAATVSETSGSHDVTAVFAGDNQFSGRDDSAPLTVSPDDSRIRLALSKVSGGVRAIATLTELDTAGALQGRRIAFSVNGGKPVFATTNAAGEAIVILGNLKPHRSTVQASFAGDDLYLPAQTQSRWPADRS